jgi:formate dehydrogenase accessory protein FdhE
VVPRDHGAGEYTEEMTPKAERTYHARILRAAYLQTVYPYAAEILTFYGRICSVQERLSTALRGSLARRSPPIETGKLREHIDVDLVLPFLAESLKALLPNSPGPLAEFIKAFLKGSRNRSAAALQQYAMAGGTDEAPGDSREELIARVLVDPYAALLAARQVTPTGGKAGNLCPNCGGRPVAGVLRIEGDGGKRYLLCAFCSTEWEFRRIYCAYCGEAREESLPVFVAEKFPQIRVEACDTCRHCIRTVDLTKDGHAISVVDDLAAIPLALWAEEYGYQRIHGNLLGT